MVLRLGPPDGLFAPYAASPEFTVLRALHAQGLPVPAVFHFDDDTHDFGAPFIIAQQVQGSAPLPWQSAQEDAFSAETRDRLAGQLVDALVALHRFAWQKEDVRLAGKEETTPGNAAQLQLAFWERELRRWQMREYPAAEHCLAWLKENCPQAPRVSVIHGDYRIGNFLVHEGHISAILDWELVHLGDPHEDIGYMCQRAFASRAPDGSPLVCHLLTREDLFERYASVSGIPVDLQSVAYYEIFNAWKLLVIHVGAAHCFERGSFNDLRMPAMGAQIPRMLRAIETKLEAIG